MRRWLRCGVVAAVCAISSGVVFGQSILVSQSQINLNAVPGGSSPVTTFPMQTTGGPLAFNISFLSLSGGNWLTINQASGTLPFNLLMVANAATLAPGIYTGNLTITATGATNSPLTIPVTFNVGVVGTSTIAASPTALTFNGQVGGTNPGSQTLAVNPFGSTVSFFATVSAPTGVGWLQVSPPFSSAPGTLTVSVLTAGLGVGTYYASITITPATGPPVVVPVTLIISGSTTVIPSTTALQFYYQVNTTFPAAQNFSLSGDTSAPVPFVLTPTTSGGSWLFVSPVAGNAPQTITVAANPTGLAPGTYTGNIAVSLNGAALPSQNISVTLTVSAGPLLTVGTLAAPFTYQTGGVLPAPQSVAVGSTAGPLPFSVTAATTSGSWLVVGPTTGTTPQTLTIGVNPGTLGPGTYTGVVTVTSPGVGNSPQTFTVTLLVNTVATLAVSPAALNFNYQINVSPALASQALQITTGDFPSTVSVSASTTSCGSWLQVLPNTVTTPTSVTVSVNSSALLFPQVCAGTITVTLVNGIGGSGVVQVPVSLTVSSTALLNVAPLTLKFTSNFDEGTSDPQTIALAATDGSAILFNAAASTDAGGNWLVVGPTFGRSPANLSVIVNSTGLSPGKYTGGVAITSPGLSSGQTVPVTLTVKPVTTTFAAPSALSFSQALGGLAPSAQQITISTTPGSHAFTVTPFTNGSLGWLRVTPAGGTTQGTVSVSVGGGALPVGTYSGSVSIAVAGSSNNPLVVPVTLTVTAGQGITASPASLNFTYQLGSLVNPANQVISINGTNGSVNFTTSASTQAGSGNWLSVSPQSGSTVSTLTVVVNPSGLAQGTYNGQISVTSPGSIGSPIQIPVMLSIQPAPSPSLGSLGSAASGISNAIAVGEIVTAKGFALGPDTPVQFSVNSAGLVDTTLAGTRLLFDGFPGAILYTSSGQINAIVPYEVTGRTSVQVLAEYRGLRSQAMSVAMLSAVPGIFSANSTGAGQGSVLNENSSINGPGSPALKGSVIQVYATGEGQTNPTGVTGGVTSSVLRKPVATVTATVGGLPAEVLYAGAAPDSVQGLFQVNIRIPNGVSSSDAVPIVITVGGVSSQSNLTIAVQ